ncbi:MAG: hypothetical protein NC191_02085 [Muribaculaceae bacterium]|nr:hypothetical protein [Muribaculaceae bacterium]
MTTINQSISSSPAFRGKVTQKEVAKVLKHAFTNQLPRDKHEAIAQVQSESFRVYANTVANKCADKLAEKIAKNAYKPQ